MTTLASFLCTLIAVALKGYQHKNVIGGHIKSVCFIAYLMYIFDILAVTLIIKNDWTIVFVSNFNIGTDLSVLVEV